MAWRWDLYLAANVIILSYLNSLGSHVPAKKDESFASSAEEQKLNGSSCPLKPSYGLYRAQTSSVHPQFSSYPLPPLLT